MSALNRDLPGMIGITNNDLIQTDASINPGNSGGPLLNSRGRVIGMNALIYSQSGGSSGIGFAIPVNTIKHVVKEILQHGKIKTPGIGVIPIDDAIAKQAGVAGVVIAKVMPNTPAASAGLIGLSRNQYGRFQLGDIIIGIDGKRVRNFAEMLRLIEKKKIGQTVTVHIIRNNKQQSIKIKIADVS